MPLAWESLCSQNVVREPLGDQQGGQGAGLQYNLITYRHGKGRQSLLGQEKVAGGRCKGCIEKTLAKPHKIFFFFFFSSSASSFKEQQPMQKHLSHKQYTKDSGNSLRDVGLVICVPVVQM